MNKNTYATAREITQEINSLGKLNNDLKDSYVVGIIVRDRNLVSSSSNRQILFIDIPESVNISTQIKSTLLSSLMSRVVYLKHKFSKL